MKKLKRFLLSICILLLATGCDGVYNVEIYNGRFKEDITITETDSNNWDDINENKISFRELLDAEYNRDNYYYKKKLISNTNELGLNYKSDFDFDTYSTLGIGYRCYDYFRVVQEEKSILIITSNKNTCYDKYKWLNDITINVKTNHKVIDNNADKVNGTTYTWHLTRDNAANKVLQIRLSSTEHVYNYDNEVVNQVIIIVLVIVGIIILGLIGFVIFKAMINRANKI